MTARPTAVVFTMGDGGHFNRVLPVVHELARAGVETYVFTGAVHRDRVADAGGRFVDLFAEHAVEDAEL